MASTRVKLPPALEIAFPENRGTLNRVNYGTVNSARDGGDRVSTTYGNIDDSGVFTYQWIDTVQVNPAHDQPKLIYYSGAQPIIRWGHRRIVRTGMTASARFLGRWFFAGVIQNQFTVRGRMTGVPGRLGTTYISPRSRTDPGSRGIQLGGGSSAT